MNVKQFSGANPFLPYNIYVPDGEPKVFGGRLWLYGSFDRFGEGYCSRVYRAYSAPLNDLTNWTDHGVSFSTDAVPWSDALLYAPDALYHNGRYYLFFCLSDGTEGVAESDSPAGPFVNARQITLKNEPIAGIDPSVLEDNGHIYYTWGQFHLNMAELGDDLCTLKPDSLHTDVLSNAPGREGFHEGSSLRKLGGKYCLIYASEYADAYPNAGARPTKLDWALADAPYGPYVRRGTVIDNEGLDPASWNDHGSVIKTDSGWFVFYHASTNNSAFSRRARVEKLDVDEAAHTIKQACPTSAGFLDALPPEGVTSPVNAFRFFGGAYVTETPDGRFPCVGLSDGAGFAIGPVAFKKGYYMLTLAYRAEADLALTVYLDGSKAANVPLPEREVLSSLTLPFFAPGGNTELKLIIQNKNGAPTEIDALNVRPAET
ncbi:MAG: family 43 glycosylhydrolase [Clostridia bacterium]|nr:family 43 glycosylhydrolase [Clostridia bacterium]